MKRLSLFHRFSIIGFVIMVLGMLGIGWWLGEQIKAGVIRESGSTSALYMDSFIATNLQELNNSNALTPEHITGPQSFAGPNRSWAPDSHF